MRLREKILEVLRNNPKGLRQSEIAKALGASRSRVSEIVKELEKAGLVIRIRERGIQVVKLSHELREKKFSRILKLGIIWSSEYPFITPFAKFLEKEHNLRLDVIVYENGLDATLDRTKPVL
mgnify:CR=1 FL=1